MNYLSIYLITPLLAWFFAHLLKFVIAVLNHKEKIDWRIFFKSGGFPSAHSAVMVSTTVVIGARMGVDSAIFGLSAVVTTVFLYDAINSRRSVGEQGWALKQVVSHLKLKENFFVARGHNILEVIMGALLGVCIALVMLQIL